MRNPSTLSLAVVALLGVINVARGCIHLLAPDGGLEMIAGFELGAAAPLVLSFIGAVGAEQLTMAMVDISAVAFFRPFARPLLLIHTVQAALGVFLLFVWRPLPHAVPGQWGVLATLVIVGFVAALEFSRTKDAAAA